MIGRLSLLALASIFVLARPALAGAFCVDSGGDPSGDSAVTSTPSPLADCVSFDILARGEPQASSGGARAEERPGSTIEAGEGEALLDGRREAPEPSPSKEQEAAYAATDQRSDVSGSAPVQPAAFEKETISRSRPTLEWTWLAAGLTVFAGSAAALTAIDARALEEDLHGRLDLAKKTAQPGSVVMDLADRADRRAEQANTLWTTTAALGAVTAATMVVELWVLPAVRRSGDPVPRPVPLPPLGSDAVFSVGVMEQATGMTLKWRFP